MTNLDVAETQLFIELLPPRNRSRMPDSDMAETRQSTVSLFPRDRVKVTELEFVENQMLAAATPTFARGCANVTDLDTVALQMMVVNLLSRDCVNVTTFCF